MSSNSEPDDKHLKLTWPASPQDAFDRELSKKEWAQYALHTLHKNIARPDRNSFAGMFRSINVLIIVALFPLVAAIGASFLAPDSTLPVLSEAQQLALGDTKDTDLIAANAILAKANEPLVAYRGILLLIGAYIVLAFYLGSALPAQWQLSLRYWRGCVGHGDDKPKNLPIHAFVYAGLIIASAVYLAQSLMDLPGPLESAVEPMALAAVGLATIVSMTLAFVTLFASHVVGTNYPGVRKSEEIAQVMVDARHQIGASSFSEVVSLALRPTEEPDDEKESDEATIMAELPSPIKPKVPVLDEPRLNIDSELMPSDAQQTINDLCLVLAVALCLAIAVLSFAGSALVSTVSAPEAYTTALQGALDAWVIFVGLGASCTLAVAYAFPVLRLMRFAYVETEGLIEKKAAPKPAAKEWEVKGSAGLSGINLTATEILPAGKPAPWSAFKDIQHARRVGIAEKKMLYIIKAADIGGAFHTLTANTLKTQIKSLVAVIAPATAGTFLSLLG
ncbi:MAG: hypothetical protein AAFM92_06785 [Pseudomonadota bacterium]